VLVTAGYTQQINQALRAFLTSEGYTGSLNQAHNQWLGTEGSYPGNYNWKMRQWEAAGFPLSFGAGPSGDALLMESSGYILLESGDYLLLE